MNSSKANSAGARVSVCIPSYNASKYIGETIRSVLDSTYTNLEIIVNDDASTDDTREIVENFSDARVHFFQNKKNLGPGRNWNRALEKASGEFVGLLNHDDLYGPFWLTFAVHVLEKRPSVGWVATAYRIINDKGRKIHSVSHFAETGECNPVETFLLMSRYGALGPAYIARREILEEVNYYDAGAGPFADHDLWYRLTSRYPLYYSNKPHHAAWRLHAANLSHRVELVEKVTICLRMLNKVFGDDALPEELRACEKPCYLPQYRRVFDRGAKLLEKGDFETIQRLIGLLHTNGYKNGQIDA